MVDYSNVGKRINEKQILIMHLSVNSCPQTGRNSPKPCSILVHIQSTILREHDMYMLRAGGVETPYKWFA